MRQPEPHPTIPPGRTPLDDLDQWARRWLTAGYDRDTLHEFIKAAAAVNFPHTSAEEIGRHL